MPWKECSIVKSRLLFVVKSFEEGIVFSELCKEFGISTRVGYKWKKRFLEGGEPALEDRSRKPKTNPRQLPEDVICELIKLKNMRPTWGPKKIQKSYAVANKGRKPPAVSTVERILSKAGLVKKKKRRRIIEPGRIQNRVKSTHPNHVWTVDFKGWWYTPLQEKCEPLTIRDDFSKYVLDIRILKKGDIYHVKQAFKALFQKYGLPEIIRSDNGPPFASGLSSMGLTQLSVWWLSLGIELDRIDPGKPYQNGGHERMHLDMKRELEGKIHGSLKHHQAIFDIWKDDFNKCRPHEALGLQLPADVYQKSPNKYQEIDEILYPKQLHVRTVNNRGNVRYKAKRIFLSNAFNGFNVGIKDTGKETIEIYFGNVMLGTASMKTLLFTPNEKYILRKNRKKV